MSAPRNHRELDLRPATGKDPEKVREAILTGPWNNGLSRARVIENLFMVASGIRRSSMFHPVDEFEIEMVHRAARAAGLGMSVRTAGRRVLKVFIFGREREEMGMLFPDIDETMGDREFIIAQITVAKMTGAFLDFPKCCTDRFIGHLMQATDQDREATERLGEHRSPDHRAYFVERFVPCSPDCLNAIEEGRRIERRLHAIDEGLLEEYLSLRAAHVEEVRTGAIVEEKRKRDEFLKRNP